MSNPADLARSLQPRFCSDPLDQERWAAVLACADAFDKLAKLAASQREANHAQCHDLVCNGNRRHPRGAKGVGCSCGGRDTAYLSQREAFEAGYHANFMELTTNTGVSSETKRWWSFDKETSESEGLADAYAAWLTRQAGQP